VDIEELSRMLELETFVLTIGGRTESVEQLALGNE